MIIIMTIAIIIKNIKNILVDTIVWVDPSLSILIEDDKSLKHI